MLLRATCRMFKVKLIKLINLTTCHDYGFVYVALIIEERNKGHYRIMLSFDFHVCRVLVLL